jgi:hypothetical protein
MSRPFQLIPALQSLLSNYRIATRFYIDRIRIYFDARTSHDELFKLMETQESYNSVQTETLPKYPWMDRMIDLLQPDRKTLKQLGRTPQGDYVINYIELAFDFIPETREQRLQLRKFFEHHLVHEQPKRQGSSYPYRRYRRTLYFGRQDEAVRLALYSHRKKGNARRCVHLEYRFQGRATLKKLGILTMKDLLSFNHEAFWESRLDLRYANLTELGKLLPFKGKSRRGAIKHAQVFMENLSNVQKLHQQHPDYISGFKRIATKDRLRKCLSAYLL